jgi:ribosomal protein L17
MKIKFFLLAVGLLSTLVSFGQDDDKGKLETLKEKLPKNEVFKAIKAHKETAEGLVTKLKNNDVDSRKLKRKYNKAKDAYDKVLDAMQEDVNNAGYIGGLVEVLAETNSRRDEYKELSEEAFVYYEDFVAASYEALDDEMGIIKDLVDMATSLLPGIVKEISNKVLTGVQKIITYQIDNARFQDWDDI